MRLFYGHHFAIVPHFGHFRKDSQWKLSPSFFLLNSNSVMSVPHFGQSISMCSRLFGCVMLKTPFVRFRQVCHRPRRHHLTTSFGEGEPWLRGSGRWALFSQLHSSSRFQTNQNINFQMTMRVFIGAGGQIWTRSYGICLIALVLLRLMW